MTGRKGKRKSKKDPSEFIKPKRGKSRSSRFKRVKKSYKDQKTDQHDSSSSDVSDEVHLPSPPQKLPDLPTLGIADPDLTECLFSDEEERAQYMKSFNTTCGHKDCQDAVCLDDVHLRSGLLSSSDITSPSSTGSMLSSTTMMSPASSTLSFATMMPDTESVSSSLKETPSRPSSSRSARMTDLRLRPSSALSSTPSCVASRTLESQESFGTPGSPSVVQTEELISPIPDASALSPVSPAGSAAETVSPSPQVVLHLPPQSLIDKALTIFKEKLPSSFVAIADRTGFHLMFLSAGCIKSIQRDVFIAYDGKENVVVHCQRLPFESTLLSSIDIPLVKLDEDTVGEFCKRAVRIALTTMQYKICVGANHMESQDVWENIPDSYIDTNAWQEDSYKQTCRSISCKMLIKHGRQLRCASCDKVIISLKKRSESLHSETVASHTANKYLSNAQKDAKLKSQAEELKKRAAKIAYLSGKIKDILNKEGVDVNEDFSDSLYECLSKSTTLNDVRKMFLMEQLECAGKSDPRAHRWHPSMIRLALYVRMQSPAAYDALRDSGALLLPCKRTLFDYSHAFDVQAGVSDGMLKLAIKKFSGLENDYQKFVALMVDEMYISKNLVYRQSDGEIVGYVHLNEVEKEISRLENYVSGKGTETKLPMATKMCSFMVKGLTSRDKIVVASYPCSTLTKEMLYQRTWEVISRLERSKIKVLVVICDGSSVNRAFIEMHTPLTKNSDVVFDTINLCSPDRRPLYFMSDVAHLIKTIRNSFYSSGEGPKKTRCLIVNGQKIMWKTIIQLYLSYKQCNLRKSYKLNTQNVFINSFSRMNVKHAVHVLSETVAADIESQQWKDTEETVAFIRRWNKFFDCLNGLKSSEHIGKRNNDLAPYMQADDTRFEYLQSCIGYLEEWSSQSETLAPAERPRSMLPQQTIDGIKMAISGFTASTKYLLSKGAKFVMARAFSQDHLENYFSRQRAKGGGSNNPNCFQFLSQQVSMGIQSELGIRRTGANVEQGTSRMELSDEPLAKRKRSRVKVD